MNNFPSKSDYWYAVGIAILLIIFITVVFCAGNDKMESYFSIASSVVGIVLGMVAIIYSFFANSDISTSMAGLLIGSREIENAAKNLSELAEKINSTAVEGSEQFRTVNDNLKKLMESPPKASHEVTKNNQEAAKILLESSPPAIGLLIYCSALSYIHRKPFKSDLSDLWGQDYVTGCMNVLQAARFIDFSYQEGFYTIRNIDTVLKESVLEKLHESIETFEDNIKTYMKTEIGLIVKFFATE